ncbi:MAG: HNH endonuclease, partial [Nocardioides sp.]
HLQPWTHGGATDLTNGISLCGHHHRRTHDPDYTTTRLPNGTLKFHRRT